MCGIAGISLHSQHQAAPRHLQPLAEALIHRGPDGEGTFAHGTLGLVHRRLSILDVSGGAQPFVTGGKEAPVALVANGEIYNYKALQLRCAEDGTHLATQSDCEPLLHRFQTTGEAALDELRGMYAVALADAATETLYLAVDPFGIKPLYYAQTSVGFAFASEPKALLASGWVRPAVNTALLPQLLNRHYTVGDETLFKGIFRLTPGERLTVRHGKIVARRTHQPELPPAGTTSESSPLAAFKQTLTSAVERHLQADVPYGLLLSGGLDSSALALAMHRLGAPIHAYTAQIQVPGGVNEAETAAQLAKAIGAEHTVVPYGEADFWPDLAKLAWAMDDLATDYAALPLLKLTARARQDVKILLSGEGGDEILAGYGSYRKPASLWRTWLKRLKAHREGDAAPHSRLFRISTKLHSVNPSIRESVNPLTPLQKRQLQDIHGWLPHDLLLKLDRTTMAHGIEGRVPFLDDTFAAWAFGLPDAMKTTPDYGKLVLRMHLAEEGYGELAWARKQGFSVAVGNFLKPQAGMVREIWHTSPLLNDILHPGAADALLGRLHHPKCANLSLSLTLLALWHRIHVEGQPYAAVADDLARLTTRRAGPPPESLNP